MKKKGEGLAAEEVYQIDPASYIGLSVDICYMVVYRISRDKETLGDLLVCQALVDEADYLRFALCDMQVGDLVGIDFSRRTFRDVEEVVHQIDENNQREPNIVDRKGFNSNKEFKGVQDHHGDHYSGYDDDRLADSAGILILDSAEVAHENPDGEEEITEKDED